jgi:hypothetical protein
MTAFLMAIAGGGIEKGEHNTNGLYFHWPLEPYFLTARTDPTVDRSVAVTDHGTEVELLSSAVVPKFALRFAAAGLPPGKEPPLSSRSKSDGR